MSKAWVGCVRIVAMALLLIVGSSHATAHNPNTSYARFVVARDQFTAKFTFDITSLLRIAPTLDANSDRQLTPAELKASVPTIVAYLQKAVACELDDRLIEFDILQPVDWPIAAGDAIAERDCHAAISLVSFVFVKSLEQPPVDVWVKFNGFETLGLRHTVLGVFEHDGEQHKLLFSAFEPDCLFETTYNPAPMATVATTSPTRGNDEVASVRRREGSLGDRLRQFFHLGVEHIRIGYDHLLFLFSLIVVSRFGELVRVVTSFTVAHSITLAIATLGWVELPSRLVETTIAVTIVYTAIENLWIQDTSGRWKLTFLFGLIHGFGFAGVLRDLELPTEGVVRSLLAFNFGVEAGQLAFAAALAFPATIFTRWSYGPSVQRALSALIALCGLGWVIDRTFALGLMPF
jgi:hypothetical protein